MLVFNCDTELNFITVIGKKYIYRGDKVVVKTSDGKKIKGRLIERETNLNVHVDRHGEVEDFSHFGCLREGNDVVIKTKDGQIIKGNVASIELNAICRIIDKLFGKMHKRRKKIGRMSKAIQVIPVDYDETNEIFDCYKCPCGYEICDGDCHHYCEK